MIVINCKCGDVRKFKSEVAFLRATPNSIHYCRKCGSPVMPGQEPAGDEPVMPEPTPERIAEIAAHNARVEANLKAQKASGIVGGIKMAPTRPTQFRMF